jgi:hypothetical protein
MSLNATFCAAANRWQLQHAYKMVGVTFAAWSEVRGLFQGAAHWLPMAILRLDALAKSEMRTPPRLAITCCAPKRCNGRPGSSQYSAMRDTGPIAASNRTLGDSTYAKGSISKPEPRLTGHAATLPASGWG